MDELKELAAQVGLPPSLEIKVVDGVGRGLFAKTSISVGTEIFSSLPFAHCTSVESRGCVCDFCLLSSETLKRCGSCKLVYYCNASCQRDDWLMHKNECAAVKRVMPKQPTPLMRLVCRVLSRSLASDEWTVDRLCSVSCLSSDGGDKSGEMAFMTALTQLTSHSHHSLQLIMRKLICNTFSISSPDLSSVGIGLYSAASLLNHSCQPNAVAVFTGSRLSLRAVRPVCEGQQLFISYIETLQLWSERQAELQQTYNFVCVCERCEADQCQHTDSSESRLIMEVNGRECSRQALDKQLKEIEQLKSNKNWKEMSSKAEALYLRHSPSLAAGNIVLIHLADLLFHSSLELHHWQKALQYSILLSQSHLDYYSPHHPVSVMSFLRTGKLRRLLGTTEQLQLSTCDLTKARDAAVVVFGQEHPVTREANEMLQDSQLALSIS